MYQCAIMLFSLPPREPVLGGWCGVDGRDEMLSLRVTYMLNAVELQVTTDGCRSISLHKHREYERCSTRTEHRPPATWWPQGVCGWTADSNQR